MTPSELKDFIKLNHKKLGGEMSGVQIAKETCKTPARISQILSTLLPVEENVESGAVDAAEASEGVIG